MIRCLPRAMCLLFLVGATGASSILLGDPQPDKPAEDVLRNLKPKHPRFYVLDDELPAVKRAIEDEAVVGRWHERLQNSAKKMLDEAPVEHKLEGPHCSARAGGHCCGSAPWPGFIGLMVTSTKQSVPARRC